MGLNNFNENGGMLSQNMKNNNNIKSDNNLSESFYLVNNASGACGKSQFL